MLDHEPAASVVGDCFFCHGHSSVPQFSGLQWKGKTIQEGKGACEALIYCIPSSTVPSISAMGLGEMSSGRQQAAELDQPPVL